MKRTKIICFAFFAIFLCVKSYSQSFNRREVERKIYEAAMKARDAHRAKQRQKAETEARVREQTRVQTQQRVDKVVTGNQILQQTNHAEQFKTGPSGKEVTNAEKAQIINNKNIETAKITNKNEGVEQNNKSQQGQWDYGYHPSQGGKVNLVAKKFEKPNRIMNPQNKLAKATPAYRTSSEVNANYGQNNPQGRVVSNNGQRQGMIAQVQAPNNQNTAPKNGTNNKNSTQKTQKPNSEQTQNTSKGQGKQNKATKTAAGANITQQGVNNPNLPQNGETAVPSIPDSPKQETNSGGNNPGASGSPTGKDLEVEIGKGLDTKIICPFKGGGNGMLYKADSPAGYAVAANKAGQEGLMYFQDGDIVLICFEVTDKGSNIQYRK